MMRLAYRLLFFAAVSAGLGLLLQKFYEHRFRYDQDPDNKIFWILGHAGTSFDVGAIGSSRVFNMLDIRSLEGATGKTGINLGNGGTDFAENYLTLSAFLRRNKLGTLLIETDVFGLNSRISYSYPFHPYNFLASLADSTVLSVFEDMVSPWRVRLWRYVPFAKYIEFNEKYPLYSMLRRPRPLPGPYDSTQGSMDLPLSEAAPLANFADKEYGSDPLDGKYLRKLVETAQANGVRVVFYSAPLYAEIRPHQIGRERAMQEIARIASGYGIPYLDFEGHPLSRDPANFLSAAHLNAAGTRQFSLILADSLRARGYL